MALALGVAAMFFGVVFIIVGWKGGGPANMEGNLLGMMKGEYLPKNNPQNAGGSLESELTNSTTGGGPTTSTTGGANSSGKK